LIRSSFAPRLTFRRLRRADASVRLVQPSGVWYSGNTGVLDTSVVSSILTIPIMPAKKKDDEITVEALVRVTAPGFDHEIRTFDKAWHQALELPVPVRMSFVAFVRKLEK
jgi:hypothetical protein